MTLPSKPASRNPEAANQAGSPTVDLLPRSVLHQLIADLPGPRGETGAARAARFDTQLAEVLGFGPRNSAEAMLAAHCVLLRTLWVDANSEAARSGADPGRTRKLLRAMKQFEKQSAAIQRALADFQARPPGRPDPAIGAALRLDTASDPDDSEEAFSAVIVPLHPAPQRLQ